MKSKLDELEYIFTELSKMSSRMGHVQGIVKGRCDMPDELDISTICNKTLGAEVETENLCPKAIADEYKLRIIDYERQIECMKHENEEYRNTIKALRAELIEMQGAVRIICRIKPRSIGTAPCQYDDTSIMLNNKRFLMDKVFGPEGQQEQIYKEVKPLIEEVVEGYKVCIFAYGQTGSGKTYTMEGPPSDKGVIYRALDNLGEISAKLATDGYHVEYSVKCLEIYNDDINCLIGGNSVQFMYDGKDARMQGCVEIKTRDIAEVYDALHSAVMRRKIGDTKCNMQSSRSHFIFIMKLRVQSQAEVREGAMVLVDLAGSERLSESKAENERLKETQCINKSLSALGNVFAALRRGDAHVPFRDTKLTYLMKEYLSGQSKTVMIANIDLNSTSEAICSLRFASKVGECELGKAKRNFVHDI